MRFAYHAGQVGKRFRSATGGGGDDPFANDVVALLHFNGADGSTTFTDETGKTWTRSGTAEIDTGQSKFGGSSLLVGNSGISTASDAGFGFGSGEYTIEGWCYVPSGTGSAITFFDTRTASNTGISIYVTNNSGTTRIIALGSNTAFIATSASNVYDLSTWFHLAVCRVGTTVNAYVNGTSVCSVTDSRTYASASTAFIGIQYNGTAPMNTHIDEVRVTKGVARYTANFTAPTAEFPNP